MANTVITPSVFAFQQVTVRTIVEGSQVWFVARDVCNALGLKWHGKFLENIPADWQGMRSHLTPSGSQRFRVVSEPAVYKLAFRSNKSEADAFTNWVASEVLPSIRKDGKFEPTPKPKKKLPALPLRSLPRVEQAALPSRDHAAALAIKALNPAPGLSGEFYEAELLRVFRDFAAWRTGVLARMEELERDYSRVTGLLHRDVLRKLMEGTPLYMTDMGAWAMGESFQDAVKAVREGVAKWECLFSKAQWFAKTLRVNW